MAVVPAEKYPVRSGGREGKIVTFAFDGANGANPTASTIVDPCNVIDEITRDAEGSYKCKLLTKYACIQPLGSPNVESTTATAEASLDTITDGTSATNYVYVTAFTGGAADDLDSVTITVAFIGYAEE